MEREVRNYHFPATTARIETRNEGEERITGFAAIFYDGDARSEFDLFGDGSVSERIMPGAFDAVLRDSQDVRGLFNHSPDFVLGRTSAGTMRLSIEDRGLSYEIDPPPTQVGRDVVESIRRGDVSGSSFSFIVARQSWIEDGERRIREIHEVRQVWDVGPVTFPAYEGTDTDIARRSLEAFRNKRTQERLEVLQARQRLNELIAGRK